MTENPQDKLDSGAMSENQPTEDPQEESASTEDSAQVEEIEEGEEEVWIDAPEVELHLSRDRMQILLDYPSKPDDVEEFIETIRKSLLERGVDSRLLGHDLDDRIREVAESDAEGYHEVLLVKGKPPEPPVDGYIEWGGDFFTRGFHVDEETGAIDYRRHVAQTSVEINQLLATIMPPQPGKPGYNVLGRPVSPRKPTVPLVKVGQNVRQVESEGKFYATASGRIRWISETLSVDEVFTIEGNIGLETGHISHPGALVVEGDIEQGSHVEARGDIEVRGIVERADVQTGGTLLVHGGVMGRGQAPIRAAARMQAKFIIDADVEVGRDVVIEREILQSRVKTRGAIAMQQGRLVGGSVMALGGILVGQTGSEALVPTVLTVGVDFKLQEKVNQLTKEIETLEQRRDQIQFSLKPIVERRLKLNEKQQQIVVTLLNEAKEIDRRIDELRLEITKLRAKSKELARPRLEVGRKVFPETILCIGAERMRIKDPYIGPVHALRVREGIQIRPGRLNWSTKHKPEEDEADYHPDGTDEAATESPPVE